MRRTLVVLRSVVAILALVSFSAHADTQLSGNATEARDWLKKIHTSAKRLDYSGTFLYQQGSVVRTSRITHVRRGSGELEKLEVLDGNPREYIRTNEQIVCYVPDAKTLFVEKRVQQDMFPAILADGPANLTKYYSVKKGESGRVAGYLSQAIVLTPKDNLRYGYKLWADKKTGLLLRAQTLDHRNKVVEQIAFAHIKIGDIDPAAVMPSFPDTRGWRVENTLMRNADLSAWTVKSLPPGFKKIRELKRVLSATGSDVAGSSDAAASHAQTREVSQMVFSDGLAAISVFIEPGGQNRGEGSMQQGAMNIVGKPQGDFWLTILGEVPSAAIRQVANSIEFKSNNVHP